MKQTRVSVYRNSYDTRGVIAPIMSVIDRIRSGAKGLDEKTRYCNALVITEPETYRTYKAANLPAATFSGTFPKGKRKAEHLDQHSGLIGIDIDHLPTEQIPDLLAELAQMPHVVFAFVSPSGVGIKAVVRVDPIPRNAFEHKGAYQACLDFFGNLAETYGFSIDTSGSDCSRLSYLAHFSLVTLHTDPRTISWDREAWIAAETARHARFDTAKTQFTGEADLEALDDIDPLSLDYEGWRNVGMAIKDAGFGVEVFEKWTGGQRKRSTGEIINEDIRKHWNRYNSEGITWASVVHLAKQNGYKPPAPRKRYQIHTEHPHVTSDIETAESE